MTALIQHIYNVGRKVNWDVEQLKNNVKADFYMLVESLGSPDRVVYSTKKAVEGAEKVVAQVLRFDGAEGKSELKEEKAGEAGED